MGKERLELKEKGGLRLEVRAAGWGHAGHILQASWCRAWGFVFYCAHVGKNMNCETSAVCIFCKSPFFCKKICIYVFTFFFFFEGLYEALLHPVYRSPNKWFLIQRLWSSFSLWTLFQKGDCAECPCPVLPPGSAVGHAEHSRLGKYTTEQKLTATSTGCFTPTGP